MEVNMAIVTKNIIVTAIIVAKIIIIKFATSFKNEDILNKVLSENKNLVLDSINLPFEFEYDRKMAEKGILNVRGDKNNTDSFFISKIKRI